jgi:pilus assembly protein CpaE
MKRLLIVDDEKIYQMMVYHAVKSLGFEIEVLGDGATALNAAVANPPDLIISDVMMPGLNGYELVRRLRRNPRFANTPIMILTAQAELSDKLEAFEAGADDFMTKPFEPAELLARLTVLVRRSETLSFVVEQSGVQPPSRARVIAVHSLRGGVGCSSVAVNLGAALARLTNMPTIVLDLVLTAGQIALMLNAPLRRTWADIARVNPDELDWEALQSIIGKHDGGVHLIAAPTFPTEAELITEELFAQAFRILRSKYDFIVVDLPHDFGCFGIQALDAADRIVALMAPELASIRATAAALDTYRKLDYPDSKIKLVINWTFEQNALRRKNIEAALKRTIDGALPFSPGLLVDAINTGKPVLYGRPDDKISEALLSLARTLAK